MPDQEIPKTYTPADWEDKLYAAWEASGFFNPDTIERTERYSDILPPPNANGELHLGHASGYAVMDIFGRYQRMQGKKVLLLPGKDHAGIQTQVVFEKKIESEQGITRHDLGREKFYRSTYDFCMDRSGYMRSQEKRIGLSADWSREKFTLDPEVSRRATETFVQMYTDGMIYRGDRIINWCPRCATALSDVEVIHKETPGKLFFIRYPIKDSGEAIVVATTRPETMLGDTAVAVHPDDDRYQDLIGKTIILPLTHREIPIIADQRIDRSFGTGVVKITPAHDPLDWEIGQTHGLPTLSVIDTDATITEAGALFQGLSVGEARTRILEILMTDSTLLKEEAHTINLSICERCKTPIEPLISKQWFINVDAPRYSLKRKSIEALQSDTIAFHPENMKDQMIGWLENLHDWCISRQLWWGHRIPVWYRNEEVFCGTEAPLGDGWEQEQDTLDTWFSSGQWPYTALGYPEAKDVHTFYPTDTMVMGRDLLFFWATRMVMFGFYRTGKPPFKNLYFTGLVRDKDGHKMSKSKGNGVDVLDMIDRFGADAVRLSLVLGATPGLDFRLYEEKIETFRNFTNKLWNLGRYVATQSLPTKDIDSSLVRNDADRWILRRIHEVATEVTRLIENYQLSLAGEELRDFTWNEFADWYVEIHKGEKNDTLLRYAFDIILKLWHPFMPFVTEAIHQTLHSDSNELLMVSQWPSFPETQDEIADENRFELVKELIIALRNARAEYRIEPARKMAVSAFGGSERTLRDNEIAFKRLARISEIHSLESSTPPENSILIQAGLLQAYLHLGDVIDLEQERVRLTKELAEKTSYIASLKNRLADPNFSSRAPKHILDQTASLLEEATATAGQLREMLDAIG